MQLLCIINQGDVFFVDVIPHPTKAEEYFNIRSLEIILNNGWMEKIGFFRNNWYESGNIRTQDYRK